MSRAQKKREAWKLIEAGYKYTEVATMVQTTNKTVGVWAKEYFAKQDIEATQIQELIHEVQNLKNEIIELKKLIIK